MNITHRFQLFCAGIIMSAASLAQTAHQAVIDGAYPDMRGEVVMTLDRDSTAKVWNIQDGKVVATFKQRSTDWAPRLLRYRILHGDYLNSGMSTKLYTRRANGNTPRSYMINGVTVGVNEQAMSQVKMNKASGKIIETQLNNNRTYIYRVVLSTDGSLEAHNENLADYNGYSTPDFSPKGNWIYSNIPAQLINPETGAITPMPATIKLPESSHLARFAFNADETMISLVTTNGIAVVETSTGKLVKMVEIPKKIKAKEGYSIYPLADANSFIYTGGRYDWSSKGDTNKAYIVNEKGAMELVD